MVKRIGIHFKKDSMKKKNVLLGIIIGLTTMIYSCQSDLNDTVQNISSVETPTNAVKKYVDEYTEEMYATLLLPAGITSRTSIAYKDEDEVMESYLTKTGKSVDEVYVEYVLPEKMRWNLCYLKEFSVFGDFKLMIDTVLAVLK